MTKIASRHRRVLSVLAAAVAVVVASVVAVGAAVAAGNTGLSIDGVSFSREEIDIAMERAERSGYGQGDLSGALDVLRDDLALFTFARELGASDVVRPADILDLVDEVNQERAAVRDAGGVLYGPVQYDARSFYGKSLADMRQAVLQQLEKGSGRGSVTEADVRSRFELEIDLWSEAATTYHLTRATLAGSGDPAVDAVNAHSLTGAEWTAIADGATLEESDITAEQVAQGLLSPDASALISTAADGSIIGPESSLGKWIYYRLDGRSVDSERAYEHYRTRIESLLYEELLDSNLEALRSSQNVREP